MAKTAADIASDLAASIGNLNTIYTDFGTEALKAGGFDYLGQKARGAYDEINILEKLNLKLQSGFQVSTKRAAELGYALDGVGKSLKVNSDKLKTYVVELNKLIPGQARFYRQSSDFSTQILKESDLIRNKLNLSAEALQGVLKYQSAIAPGKTSADLAESFKASSKELEDFASELSKTYDGAFADIYDGIGNLPTSVAMQFGKSPVQLAKAVIEAKKLGISLEKITSIGEGFLDVESAISNEIEMQILSGKELTATNGKSLTTEIQKATLQKDALRLTELMRDYLLENGEQLAENPYLLQKSAEMFQLTNDELLSAYSQLKLNNAIQAETVGLASKEADIADTRNATEKALDQEQMAYRDQMVDSYKNVENFTTSVTTLTNTFADLHKNAMDTATGVAAALESNKTLVSTIYGYYKSVMTGMDVLNDMKSGKIGAVSSPGWLTNDGTTKPVEDVFIPAGGSNTVVSGPKGSFSLDPDDDVIAMPNARAALSNKGDASAIIAALQGMSFHVTNVFDGDRIQSSLSIRQGQKLNNIS
jgi:hypothetical protein